MPSTSLLRRPSPLVVAFVACAALLAAAGAHASGDFAERARTFVEQQALPAGEIEITVGDIDPRLMLAPCARFEPFVPNGTRLWGRATLGVRCVEGATWTVYVPVQIKVFAEAQVATRPLPRGTIVGTGDVRLERVDLTLFPGGVYGADDAIDGKATTRMIAPGEPIKRELLRSPRIVESGDAVRVVYDGTSFALSVDGKALSSAGDGETARVAVANGRVLTGVARPGKVVQVR